jgi:hypothetical protein
METNDFFSVLFKPMNCRRKEKEFKISAIVIFFKEPDNGQNEV